MSPYIYVKEAHRYYDPIERRYYMIGDTVGNRVLTKNIFFRCNRTGSIMLTKELQMLRDTNGKEVLPMFRYCFGASIPLLISPESRVNQTKKAAEAMEKKRKRM